MGRNTLTSRQVMEAFVQGLKSFENSMPQSDVKVFEEILLQGRIHASQMDLSKISVESAFIISALMEFLKQIENGE